MPHMMSENGHTRQPGRVTITYMNQLDPSLCYAAIQAHDSRFDGLFFVAVSTTGIYCRPVCRVRMPREDRCRFYPNAASAEQAGYRPCLRCRPELAPGNAKVDAVKRVAQLAAERIQAGALTDSNLESLAGEFKLSSRQLRRAVESEYGVGPLALALTYRLLLAKQLLTDTDLKIVDVAFTSGFSSLRRFNDAFLKRYRMNPSALRRGRTAREREGIVLRLAYRPPLAWNALTHFLCSRGNSRVEQVDGGCYRRCVRLGGQLGWIAARQDVARAQIQVDVSQSLLPCLVQLQCRLRFLFDLDASPAVIDPHLSRDTLLQQLLADQPGLRVPGTLDLFELGLRAVLGQQVSVKAATTLFGRFVAAFGEPVATPFPGLDRSAPIAEKVANATLQDVIDLGLTQRRAATVHQLAQLTAEGSINLADGFLGLADGSLDAADGSLNLERGKRAVDQLLALPGIGPWTAQYIAMRALGDPNALPASDLGLLRALRVAKPADLERRAENWQPWRAYAAIHLWHRSVLSG